MSCKEYRDRDGQPMTEHELQVEALVPMYGLIPLSSRINVLLKMSRQAGSDTTSTAIRAIILYVATNRSVYRNLISELCSSQHSHPIKYQEALKLPYLQAIVTEALRIYSPVGFPGSRVVPPGGTTVFGHLIPEATWVMLPQWCVGRSKEIWGPDANIFRPERWLRQEGESEEEMNERLERWKRIDTTFGNGDVACLGKHIALMKISKAIVEVSKSRSQFSKSMQLTKVVPLDVVVFKF
jgi:cytochrome P450